MEGFWESFNKSSVMQGVIASALTGGVVYLAVTQAEIPEVLSSGFLIMLGFFFGSKGLQEVQSITQKLSNSTAHSVVGQDAGDRGHRP